MKEIRRRSDCPISYALDIFGDKWSLLILRDMMFKEKDTYGDFLKGGEKIATNILADRLATLEQAGLVACRTDEENRSRKIYTLTDKGMDLIPVMLELIKWSAKYDKQTAASKQYVSRIHKDREGLIAETKNELKKAHQ